MQSKLLRVFDVIRKLNENLAQQTKTDHECETFFMLRTFYKKPEVFFFFEWCSVCPETVIDEATLILENYLLLFMRACIGVHT